LVADSEEGGLVGKTFEKKFGGQFYSGKVVILLHCSSKSNSASFVDLSWKVYCPANMTFASRQHQETFGLPASLNAGPLGCNIAKMPM
jgi:hypothetical protein